MKGFYLFKKILANVFLCLATLFVFLLIGEIICRFSFDKELIADSALIGSFKQGGVDSMIYIDKDDGLRHDIKTGLVDKNSYYRDEMTSQQDLFVEEKNVYKIAILGDSFTMGAGLKDKNDYYPAQLFWLLNEKETNDQNQNINYQISVFGSPGINTYQELYILKDVVLSYEPNLLILQTTDNDTMDLLYELNKSGDDSSYIRIKNNVILMDDKIVPELSYLPDKVNKFFLKYFAIARFISVKLSIVETNIAAKENTNTSLVSLKKIAEIARQQHFDLTILHLPPTSPQINYCRPGSRFNYGGPLWHQQIEELAKEENITYVNLCDFIDDINILKSPDEKDCSECHYGLVGHSLVARLIKTEILPKIMNK